MYIFAKQNKETKYTLFGTLLLIKILPEESHAGLDGIVSTGKVYKIPDGTHAHITPEGKVKINSFIGNFVYLVFGGELSDAPDSGWNNLFDAKQ